MSDDKKDGGPKWILIATSLVGLVAVCLLVVTRYYEIKKARAEALRAETAAKAPDPTPKPTDPAPKATVPVPKATDPAPKTDPGPSVKTPIPAPKPEQKGEESTKSPPPGKLVELQSLFNGSDLKGWSAVEKEAKEYWSVRGGVLVNHASGPSLRTDRDFRDFELQLEFRLPERCNSGVFLRGRYEVQLTDTAEAELRKNLGARFNPSFVCGSIYGQIAAETRTYRGPNEWNTLKVLMTGNRVTVHMNGTKLLTGEVEKPTPGALYTTYGASGPLVLQSHAVPGAEFRKIMIKDVE